MQAMFYTRHEKCQRQNIYSRLNVARFTRITRTLVRRTCVLREQHAMQRVLPGLHRLRVENSRFISRVLRLCIGNIRGFTP